MRSDVEPVPGPEAFEEHGSAARMSQAAVLLSLGRAAGGQPELVDEPEALALPDLRRAHAPRAMSVGRALRHVDLDEAQHVTDRGLRLPAAAMAPLARDVVDRPTPERAASLIEGNLHSESRLVRTAAAVAALDTTGPREDLVDQLAESAHARDELVRDIGRIGLARVDPDHPALANVTVQPPPLPGRDRSSHTAVVSHGTFASRSRWWRPGGEFHAYLDGLEPPLHLHDESYQWTGLYLDLARQRAADRMVAWIADQQLAAPDWFAHSHGATVANLATQRGAELDRLVLLSWPVRGDELPVLDRVARVFDVRVRFDLVILADRGGQRLPAPFAADDRVDVAVNGWFDHGDSHDPAYWEAHDLPDRLVAP